MSWQYKIVFLLFFLFLPLLFFELAMRQGFVKTDIYKFHKETEEIILENPQNKKILILGDSFIYGGGELDKLLKEKLGSKKYIVINPSKGGNGPYDYLSLARIYIPKFKPDYVLLSYYVGNDLTNVQYSTNRDIKGFYGRTRLEVSHFLQKVYLFELFKNFKEAFRHKKAKNLLYELDYPERII